MPVTVLLDSDIVAYQFASAGQKDYNFGDTGVCRHVEELEDVVPLVHQWIKDLMEKLNGDKLVVCLSVPTAEGFRIQVLPSYKGNRANVERPVLLQKIKDYLATEYPSYIRPGLEADDCMGILATHPKLHPGTKIIVSEDKDMQTIPGFLFRPKRDKKPKRITQEFADHFHMYQTLTGDTTDGYKGCPGIGPAKARRILLAAEDEDYWPHVVEAYESKGLTEEDALVQARVARICRYEDYDFKKKEVKLWTPK